MVAREATRPLCAVSRRGTYLAAFVVVVTIVCLSSPVPVLSLFN